MSRIFTSGWIIALFLVAGATGCSDSHDGEGESSLRPEGDADGDGVPNDEDDSDGDGIVDSEDDDIDGDGIPNDQDDDFVADPGSGGAGPGGGGSVPSTLPMFPGAGTSDAGDPLPNGMLCDAVPGEELPIANGGVASCFVDKNDPGAVAATLEQVLECVEGTDTVHIRLTFHPWFVDNTYGVNAIGWPNRRGHCFGHCWTDLTKSDHAEIILRNDAGEIVLRFKLDYVSEDPSAPSGYGSLGVTGGDGSVLVGDASAVLRWSTSIDRNLNERGYDEYIPDSPATDADFSPNPDAPDWDFRVVYEAWIDLGIFGASGFDGATIEYVHASPSKSSTDTIETEPGECPPPPCVDSDPDTDVCDPGDDDPPGGPPPGCVDNDPDTFCGEGGVGGGGDSGTGGDGGGGMSGGGGNGGDPEDPCADNDPDTVCDEGGTSGGGDPQYCMDHPEDPACVVD